MCKKLKGYMTVEATYIVPIVLVIYMMFIMCGFYLYDRCVISQDNYLIALRGSRFTEAAENYGETIYGDMKTGYFLEGYVRERVAYKSGFYPFFAEESAEVEMQGKNVTVFVLGFHGTLQVSKMAQRENPLEIVKKVRRQTYGN